MYKKMWANYFLVMMMCVASVIGGQQTTQASTNDTAYSLCNKKTLLYGAAALGVAGAGYVGYRTVSPYIKNLSACYKGFKSLCPATNGRIDKLETKLLAELITGTDLQFALVPLEVRQKKLQNILEDIKRENAARHDILEKQGKETQAEVITVREQGLRHHRQQNENIQKLRQEVKVQHDTAMQGQNHISKQVDQLGKTVNEVRDMVEECNAGMKARNNQVSIVNNIYVGNVEDPKVLSQLVQMAAATGGVMHIANGNSAIALDTQYMQSIPSHVSNIKFQQDVCNELNRHAPWPLFSPNNKLPLLPSSTSLALTLKKSPRRASGAMVKAH